MENRNTVKNEWSDKVYGMFALLNNVRNYWEDKLKPLPDRGLPEDACDATLRAYCDKVIPDEQYSEKKDYYDDFGHYLHTKIKWHFK